MGATLVMAASLAIVICLILVLLVELYCSLLLRRHQLKDSSASSSSSTAITITIPIPIPIPTNTTTAPLSPQDDQNQSISPLNSAYAQGVLHAPSNFLPPCKQNNIQLTPLEIHCQEPNITGPHQIGILHPTSPSIYFATSPPGNGVENLVYISNPIYNDDAGTEMTPGTFPSSDDEAPPTPPLSPMKKLPAQACPVSLKDARCLGNSGSDSICNIALSSSSSASLCTSLSW
ncbi:hypothetical protein V6N13_081592 [Hibiscus sabdariffa]